MNHSRLISIMRGEDRSAVGHLSRLGLGALAAFYGVGVAVRNATFDTRLRKPARLGRSTISVGNLTTGGTGKTPMVVELARRLAANGTRPAVLLRGYRANNGHSDEATLLHDELGSDIPVVANPNRVHAAHTAVSHCNDIRVFVLDDGFQHRQVHRDLDLVLIDATRPFGFDHLLPRGMLREPTRNLARADAVIVTRADQAEPDILRRLDRQIERLAHRPPIAHASHQWTGYLDQSDNRCPLNHLADRRVVGVCGIANPAAFGRSLKQHAPTTLTVVSQPDHHIYAAADLRAQLNTIAEREHPDAFVTTGKDWVKWRPLLAGHQPPQPVYRPILRISFLDGADNVDALLRQALARSPQIQSVGF